MKERILTNIEPVRVLKYFEDLTFIPRESQNERAVTDYLIDFARDHGLWCYRDEDLNVIIRKPACKGYEDHPGVIMQAHVDMVCVKKLGVDHDFEKDPIRFEVEGDKIIAHDTSLGADNGIGVAYCLAVLEDPDMAHPQIEAIFTTEEENGLFGVETVDYSLITGDRVINLDSADEGIAVIGCAGSDVICCKVPVDKEAADPEKAYFKVRISGLTGGHSGEDIHRGRANANKLMGRLLEALSCKCAFNISAFWGGRKANAIPRNADVIMGIKPEDIWALEETVEEYGKLFAEEWREADPEIAVTFEEAQVPEEVLSVASTKMIIQYVQESDEGVMAMDKDYPHLVESSVCPGIVRIRDTYAEFWHVPRSSVQRQLDLMTGKVWRQAEAFGGSVEMPAGNPTWQVEKDSQLRKVYEEVYMDLYGQEPEMMIIHAALEPCKIAPRIDRPLDMISFGPDVRNLHAPGEYFTISSTQKLWDTLKELLKRL